MVVPVVVKKDNNVSGISAAAVVVVVVVAVVGVGPIHPSSYRATRSAESGDGTR